MDIELAKAALNDIECIKGIADDNRDKIGFIKRQVLMEQQKRGWLIVAKVNSDAVGFVSYRHRKDSQTTIYEICVVDEYQSNGIGTQLMDALVNETRGLEKDRIVLKCPADLSANCFYSKYGFVFKTFEQGKSRPLIVWELLLK